MIRIRNPQNPSPINKAPALGFVSIPNMGELGGLDLLRAAGAWEVTKASLLQEPSFALPGVCFILHFSILELRDGVPEQRLLGL